MDIGYITKFLAVSFFFKLLSLMGDQSKSFILNTVVKLT